MILWGDGGEVGWVLGVVGRSHQKKIIIRRAHRRVRALVSNPPILVSNPCSISNFPVLPVLEAEDFNPLGRIGLQKYNGWIPMDHRHSTFEPPWPSLGPPWAAFFASFFVFLRKFCSFSVKNRIPNRI